MYKKYLIQIIVSILLLMYISITRRSSNTITQVNYSGESSNWKATVRYNVKDNYTLKVKYLGKEKFPLNVTIIDEFLSGKLFKYEYIFYYIHIKVYTIHYTFP